MMNLRSNQRTKVPNSLAFFAFLLLLISAATGFETTQETISSGQETHISAKSDSINQTTKTKSPGLSLGLMLFRRG